ncbi:hypothetical protein [Actinoplanes cyaneus]|uniref:hypothetical protein n=1 Tax=Actinoplanes cyaneus TaxID=52696 RepID=UPI0019409305|nr:hypothetical protein [Actinoplanes cyaneus]
MNEVFELIPKTVAVAICALALFACSAPASRPTAAARAPSAPARPLAATCETPQFTWSHVKSAPVLGAVSPRLDLTEGMRSDVPLEAVLSDSAIKVTPASVDTEMVLTSLENNLSAGDAADVWRLSRPGTPVEENGTKLQITAGKAGAYVGYRVVMQVSASYTYTCGPASSPVAGSVSTWSSEATVMTECGGQAGTEKWSAIERKAVTLRCS